MTFFSDYFNVNFFLMSILFLNVNLFGQTEQYYQNNYPSYQIRGNPSSTNRTSDYQRSVDQQNYNRQNYYQTNQQYVNDQNVTREGDWEYHNNWRYHKQAYLNGENASQYYRRTHPYGQGGIGYDADEDYLNLQRDISQRDRVKQDKIRSPR